MSQLDHKGKYWQATPLRRHYATAFKERRRVGATHATGDSLRAMYASLVAFTSGGEKFAPLFFLELLNEPDDKAIAEKAREWMRDPQAASKVAFGKLDEIEI